MLHRKFAVCNSLSRNQAPTSVIRVLGVWDSPHKLLPIFLHFRKHVQISDVNGDGLNELIVTLTDRVVRTYQWRKSSKEGELMALSKWEFADQVGSFAMCQRNGEPHLLVTQSDGILMKPKDEDHFQMTNILEQQFFEKEMPPEVATDLRVNGKPTPSLGKY